MQFGIGDKRKRKDAKDAQSESNLLHQTVRLPTKYFFAFLRDLCVSAFDSGLFPTAWLRRGIKLRP